MKRFLSVIIVVCLVFGVLPAYSITASADSGFEYDEETKTLTIYSMISGDENPFKVYGEQIETLIICEDVTELDLTNLAYCTSISEIIVDDENKNYVTDSQGSLLNRDKSVLVMCADVENLIIPATVTTIEDGAFASCASLASIEVDEDNPEYSSDEFGVLFNKDKTILIQYPDELEMESYIIPDSVIIIYDSAFEDSDNLTSMIIPDGVTTIGESSFEDCDGITALTLGNGLVSIGDYAFLDCDSFTELVIPDSVTSLGIGAFEDCTGILTVTIGNGIEIISENAFEDCDGIVNLTLGKNVEIIDEYAFYDCHSLKNLVIPDSVTTINEGAFEDNNGLVSLKIGDGVTHIGISAFEDCDSLVDITFGDNISVIDNYAFYDCHSIKEILIPDSVITIGEGVFEDNMNLESVKLSKNLRVIGECAFEDCDSLKSIVIPESVTTLCESAFFDCYALESIVIGKNLSSVGTLTFSGCYKLLNFYFTGSQAEWGSTPAAIRDFVKLMKATVYYNCSSNGEAYRFAITSPSKYVINHKDGIVLHTEDNGMLPKDIEIKWSSSNKKFATEESVDGKTLTIISRNNGYTIFSATVYDADGVAVATDIIEIRSKAGFFDKIGGYFRSLFGLTMIYEN